MNREWEECREQGLVPLEILDRVIDNPPPELIKGISPRQILDREVDRLIEILHRVAPPSDDD